MNPARPRRRHGLGIVLVTVLASTALLSVAADNTGPHMAPQPRTAAVYAATVTGSQWRAGNIISDSVFYNSSTMSAAGIQSFLNQEAPSSCPGTTCLNVNHFNTTNQPAETGLCAAYTGKTGETAAAIFYNVSKACGVNPQSLLVLGQKESSVITSSSPNYTTTMGYGCPDSTGCASKYYGFFNQVYLAARQFKLYRLHPTNYGYVAGETNYILYNPKVSCGGSNVFIENQATAGLYDYTPYQPNAAALANLHGTGDSCSAYGNRNFWVFFNNWFGNTTGLSAAPQSYDRGGLVGTKTSDHSIWYYSNKGTPLPLAAGVQVASSTQLSAVVTTGDATGDGLADVITATSAGALWMFTNTGTTQPYGSPIQIGWSGWQQFNRLVLADVTGDGRDEMVVTRPDGTAGYYPNTGNNARPIGTLTALGSGWQAFTSLTTGDVNSDGFADLIATKADGSLWWLRSSGDASKPFGSWARLGSTNFSDYNTIVGDDTNADGRADLIARKPDGSLWLFVNTGSTSNPYTTPTQIGYTGWSQFSTLSSITVPVPHRSLQANVVVRNPSGTGTLDTLANAAPPNPFTTSATIGASGWGGYRLVVSADIEDNGKADLVAVDKTGVAWLYRNTGVPTRPYNATRIKISTGWGSMASIRAGDVNGDGKADLVTITSTGALELFVNTGSATAPFGAPVQIGYSGWQAFPAVALADVTGDHKADLAVSTTDGTLRLYSGNGSVTHPFSTYTTIGWSGWQKFTNIVAVTRHTVAGTAPSDLLAIGADGSASLYRNEGLSYRPYIGGIPLPGTPFASQGQVSGATITGTGRTDVLATTAAGALVLDQNQGTDVFASPLLIGSSSWNNFKSIAVGDVTGDGLSDLIAIKPIGQLYLYVASTTATHPYGIPFVIGYSGWQNFTQVMVADMTGDGLADLVAIKSDGSMMLYQADTTADHPYGDIPVRQIGSGWQDFTQLALGDVTGDGLPDVVGIQADGSLWLAANIHNPSAPFGTPVKIGTGWQLYNHLLLGDVEHDGLDDIVGVRPDGSAWYCRNLIRYYPTAPFGGCVPTTSNSWNSYDLAAL